MLAVSNCPWPLLTCCWKATVAAAPSGVGEPPVWAAAWDRRRSLSINWAEKPGVKSLSLPDPGLPPGSGQAFSSTHEFPLDADITS